MQSVAEGLTEYVSTVVTESAAAGLTESVAAIIWLDVQLQYLLNL